MNGNIKIARFTWLFLLTVVALTGCRQASVPPPNVSQNQPSQEADPATENNTTENKTADDNTADDNTADDNTADDNTAEDKTADDTATTSDDDEVATDDDGGHGVDVGETDPNAPPLGDDDAETGHAADDDNADDDTSDASDNAEAASVAVAVPDQAKTPDKPATERFALLTAGGPLVVDVMITIDGDVHSSALEELVDDAYEAADTDGDGERTWEEVANSPKFMYGQFGNLPVNDESQKKQLIEKYDRNENGLVDRNELPRFVTRNVGRAKAFSLLSSNEFRSDNRTRSPFRRLLDADHDGAITPEEMAEAPARLLTRDADDDQIITLADFKEDAQAMPGQMSARRRTNEPDTAI